MAGSTSKDDDSPQTNGYSPKRNAEDGSGSHTRAKRNRYISIACNECKRRKIKCNGQTPCQRCGNLSLECLYAPNCCSTSVKDSEEFQQMKHHISVLQEQVDNLYSNLNDLRKRQDTISSMETSYSQDEGRSMSASATRSFQQLATPNRPHKSVPQFHGHTSSAYGFDVAKSSLQTMGITQDSGLDDGEGLGDRTPTHSPFGSFPVHQSKDPLWTISKEEAIRLCRVYEEEIGNMYPLFDIDHFIKHINMLWIFIEAALRAGFGQPHLPGADAIEDDDTNILKLILATTMYLEGNGQSGLGQRFFESVKPVITARIEEKSDIKSLTMIIMTATLHFHRDEEVLAWRFIGIASRLCTEMGLHRKDSMIKTFTNEAEYLLASRLFWIVYALDRRWSFGTGMPFALQDADIDPFLPEPDDSTLYLKHITKYNHIASKVWYYNLACETGTNSKRDEIGFLDFQVLQWYQQLPESLIFDKDNLARENEIPSKGLRRLRLLMALRRNQARITIYRPILLSATSIQENRHYAQNVVDVAKDTISILARSNQTADLYRTQQVTFNYFLVQALAAIFLAVSHAPAEFCRQTREEFYAALELVRGFSTKSYISKRLWRTIRGLKEVGDKLGLLSRGVNPNNGNSEAEGDAHSDAAVAMAGLAGHPIDDMAMYGGGMKGIANELGVSPLNGQQISNELTSLFELAGGYGNVMGSTPGADGFSGYTGSNGDIHGPGDGVNAMFGSDQEFSRIMGELF